VTTFTKQVLLALEVMMATASDNGTTVKESKASPPIEKLKASSSGGQASSKVVIRKLFSYVILIREHQCEV
jgi:hypothetical protein